MLPVYEGQRSVLHRDDVRYAQDDPDAISLRIVVTYVVSLSFTSCLFSASQRTRKPSVLTSQPDGLLLMRRAGN